VSRFARVGCRSLLGVALVASLLACAPGTAVTGSSESEQPELTARALQCLAGGWQSHDRARYLSCWAATRAAQRLGADTFADLSALRVSTFGLRATPVAPGQSSAPPGSRSSVVVTWGVPQFGAAVARSPVQLSLSLDAGKPLVAALSSAPGRIAPLWLVPGLAVTRTSRTLVASADPAATARVSRLLAHAVTSVAAVLPGWHGDLVAAVPLGTAGFAAMLASSPADETDVAAVTTTADGSASTAAPDIVVVDSHLLATMGEIGARVVLTHEATHEATGAAAVAMPLWVAEGFADYVGIGSVHLPLRVAARHALALVRQSGSPVALPDDHAFDHTGDRLEATYEQAWSASVLIARTYGQSALVAFYRAVEADPAAVDAEFQATTHVPLATFTARWSRWLGVLADG
jgi:hypothetical protein